MNGEREREGCIGAGVRCGEPWREGDKMFFFGGVRGQDRKNNESVRMSRSTVIRCHGGFC